MRNVIGLTVKTIGFRGVVVEKIIKRATVYVKIALADGERRNPVLGDFTITSLQNLEFEGDEMFAPAGVRDETYAEKMAMKRAGGDATLLRR
mgnify:CR=1 FL=1